MVHPSWVVLDRVDHMDLEVVPEPPFVVANAVDGLVVHLSIGSTKK